MLHLLTQRLPNVCQVKSIPRDPPSEGILRRNFIQALRKLPFVHRWYVVWLQVPDYMYLRA